MGRQARPAWPILVLVVLVTAGSATAQTRRPSRVVDLLESTPDTHRITRVHGAAGPTTIGAFGVPVAGGLDMDGDSVADYAVAYMTATYENRPWTGEVDLVFGSGPLGESIDTAVDQARVLRIVGSGNFEATGSEIWMGDVTGDGLGDLLICRQNFNPARRIGAGALTIVVGSPALRDLADSMTVLDLSDPPATVELFTLIGSMDHARLGMWVRVGDVDGDGIDDLAVAADQESSAEETFHGAVYVVRGGSHLSQSSTVDLAYFGSTALAGSIARVTPPPGSDDFHLGATLQLGDLDGNGRAELLLAAALNRAGGVISPNGKLDGDGDGGPEKGRVFIVWDDSFPDGPWPLAWEIDLGDPPGGLTTISGGSKNVSFGEELLGGLDYDGDGRAELFVGDLVADGSEAGDRRTSGIGYVFFKADKLRGLTFNVDETPDDIRLITILGPETNAIAADTATHGDFNGDGIADLMVGSPTATPLGRRKAGLMHVFYGQAANWPRRIDLKPGYLPPPWRLRVVEVLGALGEVSGAPGQPPTDRGDVLCYSAAAGDVDGDGKTDLIVNEMVGNGVSPAAIDVGNLLVISGDMLFMRRVRLGAR